MLYSKTCFLKCAAMALIVSSWSLAAHAQVLRGNVVDGTTKKPVAGDDVILVKIDKGMSDEARTKTNARGEFSFNLPDSQSMRAVRVIHDKLPYYQPVIPGSTAVAVTVYESQPEVAGLRRLNHSVIVQAQKDTLEIVELFNVLNDSQPPHTQPAFNFYLPADAILQGGTAMREGGMPLKSAPVPMEEKGKYQFKYPLLPGPTHFEVVYTIPYMGKFKYQPKLAGPVEKFYVILPKSISFSPDSASQYQPTSDVPIGSGFKDFEVHVATQTAQESQLAFSVSGEGTLQEDNTAPQSAQAAPQGGAPAGGAATGAAPAEDERPGGGMGIPNERPNPLSQGQWYFLGILTLFLAGGAGFVFMTARPRAAVAAAAAPQNQSAFLLEALKEEMFQLETDRLQGKMSSQEYQGAKSVLDKTLQRVMRKK